jgi:hypothetical protein
MNRGYIYIIKSDFGWKIGKATDFESRFSSIQTSSPVKLILERVFSVNDFDNAEKNLHKLFKEKHIRGEWFNLDIKDLDHIKNYLKYNNYLIMEVGLKTKRLNYIKKDYSHKSVEEISSLAEIALQTEINNLKTENQRLNDAYSRLELNKYESKPVDLKMIIFLFKKEIIRITKNMFRNKSNKISKYKY